MTIEEILSHDKEFRYSLLDRMVSDCKYYLGYGNRQSKYLWAGNTTNHIAYMLKIWKSFPIGQKPKWLTKPQINRYKLEMIG